MTSSSDDMSDFFSSHADRYSNFRPTYPPELFAYVSKLCTERKVAWDCGTGNGQAARGLISHFDKVFATDISDRQLAKAFQDPKIEYKFGAVENCGLPDASVNLITSAHSFHWFQHDQFALECRRVARPGAVLAAWCYGLAAISKEIDKVIYGFYQNVVGAYWGKERAMIEDGYASIRMPFAEMGTQSFIMSTDWTYAQMLGYLDTWSAIQRYIKMHNKSPLAEIEPRLREAWGDAKTRQIRWQVLPRLWKIS